ncbi:phytase [Sphingomonadaceae bacterium jetA1]|jgi:3-phytase|uniref:phytase n=1 Tax=Facivitalis istanbulensis TaxID=3075838 RepID=UPI0034866A87
MRALLLAGAVLLAGCQAQTPPAASASLAAPTASVTARGETAPVGTGNRDAADDPAIWRNPANPAASLIVATDKQAGLYVYGLDGKRRDYVQAGRVNNVDLRDLGDGQVLVAASDRSDKAQAAIALFRLDTAQARLTPIGKVPVGAGEAYGMCMGMIGGRPYGFVVLKDGAVQQVALSMAGAAGPVTRPLKLATQSEGCVVDDRTGQLYVAEEDVGIWRIDPMAGAASPPVMVAKVDGRTLFADVEGLAIAAEGKDGGYLVASSQGDSAYTLYRLSDGAYAGRFRVVAGRYGATSETDGIEVALGDFGPAFPGGLMVVQDGENAPLAQNFKLLAWDDIVRAVKPAAR